ncbi:hypothetical protein ABZ883_04765 [Streptomyces sp. NPDC046977]|uniref:hypothetical protein n=1 Tax=Streptomyces sp. NPDC046977 TaxID=3154703 RepID=UPI0033E8DD0C
MSARITLHCNQTSTYSTCAAQHFTDAVTIDGARAEAEAAGWRCHPDGNDYCPGCSGHRATINAAALKLLRNYPTPRPPLYLAPPPITDPGDQP